MHSPTPSQLADLAAVRDCALRYSHGIDRLDPDVMRSAYWPDAVDDHGTFVGNAWEFVDRCMRSHGRWRSTLHCVLNHWVELDGPTTARGEVYNVTYLFPPEGEPSLWVGRYLDRYEQRSGEWRILRRTCVHEGTTTLAASPMAIEAGRFRSGDVDRATPGRPVGT
jgi:SnoaL-like domain